MTPDPQTLAEAATWHYAVALAVLALMGALWDMFRVPFSTSCRTACRTGR